MGPIFPDRTKYFRWTNLSDLKWELLFDERSFLTRLWIVDFRHFSEKYITKISSICTFSNFKKMNFMVQSFWNHLSWFSNRCLVGHTLSQLNHCIFEIIQSETAFKSSIWYSFFDLSKSRKCVKIDFWAWPIVFVKMFYIQVPRFTFKLLTIPLIRLFSATPEGSPPRVFHHHQNSESTSSDWIPSSLEILSEYNEEIAWREKNYWLKKNRTSENRTWEEQKNLQIFKKLKKFVKTSWRNREDTVKINLPSNI